MLSPRVYCDDGTTLTLGILIFKMQDQVSIGRSLKAQARILKVAYQWSFSPELDLGKVRSWESSSLDLLNVQVEVIDWGLRIFISFHPCLRLSLISPKILTDF